MCLVRELNNALYQSSIAIEAMLDLMEKTKSESEFGKILEQLSQFGNHQMTLGKNIQEHIESLKEKSIESEKGQVAKPQVH